MIPDVRTRRARVAQELWTALLSMLLFAVAIWCIITGAVRFVLLSFGGGGDPYKRVQRHIREQQVVFRPVTARPWWRPW